MRSLNPQFWWLAFLAIAPIVLYLFRRRSRTFQVSTLVFFKTLAREHQESEWLRRLKRFLSLLMTLLLLLGAVSALAHIVFSPPSNDTRNVVILLDRSASMGVADESGQTRLDAAKAAIRTRLDGLNESVGVSLVVYDARPEIIQSRTLKRRAFLSALDDVQVRPVAQNLDAALENARTLAKLDTPAELWQFSDAPAAATTPLPAGVKLVAVPVALEEPINVGFTAFQIRKLPLENSRYTAFVQVMCNAAAPKPVEGKIEVRVGSRFLSPRQFELKPGETSGFEIPIEGAQEQLLQLTLHAPDDCLALDNAILVPLPEAQPLVAARVSATPDPFTQLALQSLVKQGDLNIWSVEPDKWPIPNVDVAIFDHWLPKEWPTDIPVIVINPPGALGPVRAVPLSGGGIPHREIRVANADHPVLFRVSSTRLALTQTCVIDSSGSLEPLWFAGNEPVLAAGSINGQRIVLMGFSPQQSERLPFTASLPILLGNSIYWCTEERAGQERLQERKTGQVLTLAGKNLKWTELKENGKLASTAQSYDRNLVELARVGVWETDEGQRGTAHLLSRDETNVAKASADAAGSTLAGPVRGWSFGDITWILLACVLVILLLESILFHWFAVY